MNGIARVIDAPLFQSVVKVPHQIAHQKVGILVESHLFLLHQLASFLRQLDLQKFDLASSNLEKQTFHVLIAKKRMNRFSR